MKVSFLLLFSFFTLLAQGQTKKLVWAEEFDKNGLPDESTWNFSQDPLNSVNLLHAAKLMTRCILPASPKERG